jgi:EpsI family protein
MLQDLAARSAVKMLVLSGIPVLLQGHVISLPRGTWKVAEACSGINYLTASLALGYLYAGTTYRYWSHRIWFLVGAVLVPLFANGLRVYGTILVASLGGKESIAGTRHYLFGWLVFATMMGLLFAICGRWREDPAAEVVTPETVARNASATSRWRPVLVAALGLLLAALASASPGLLQAPVEHVSSGPQPPRASLPWVEVDMNPYSWTPHFQTPSAEFVRTYRSDSRFVKVYVASYAASQPRAKLASVTNVLIPEPWSISGRELRTVTFDGRSFRVRETRLEGASSSLVVWNWYSVDGTLTGSDYLAKLLLAKARIFQSVTGSAAVAIATESRLGLEPETILQDFLHHFSPAPVSAEFDVRPRR